MTLDLSKVRTAVAAGMAVAISLAAFAGGFVAAGGHRSDIVTAQTAAPTGPGGAGGPSMMAAPPGPGAGGTAGGMGMGMGPGMMGMGMGGGAGARAGGGGEWPLGRPGGAPSAPLQDYQPGGADWGTQPQWSKLVDRYWVSLQWARQINAKWNPVRREVLHYALAAQGAAATVPESHWNLTHPMDFYLEGQRAQNRWAEAYIKAQWDLVPDEVRENLKQSARLAVMRKTRLMDEEGQKELALAAQAGLGAGAGAAAAPAGAAAAASGAAAGAGAPTPAPAAPTGPSVGALKLTEADIEAFNKRVAEEYEYLMRVYIMGYDSAPWYRVAYDPQDRSFDADGRPILLDFTPPPYKARGVTGGGGGGAAAPSGGGGAGPMMGPMGGMGGAMGGRMGGPGSMPGGRSGMGAGSTMRMGAGGGSGPPSAPMTTGAAGAAGGRG